MSCFNRRARTRCLRAYARQNGTRPFANINVETDFTDRFVDLIEEGGGRGGRNVPECFAARSQFAIMFNKRFNANQEKRNTP